MSPLCYAANLSPLHTDTEVPLRPLRDRSNSEKPRPVFVRAGQPLMLRAGFLDDELALHFCQRLPAVKPPNLGASLNQLEVGVPCVLARLPQSHPDDPDWLHTSWAQLVNTAPARSLHLRFETLTYFSHQTEMRLLPEPARLWKSWGDFWPDSAPTLPLDKNALTLDGLQIAQYQLHTETIPLEGGYPRGFVGEMVLKWRKGFVDDKTLRTVAALARIANFTGTGAKTMMGLGQTRCNLDR